MLVTDAMSPIQEQQILQNKKSQEVHVVTEEDIGLSINDSPLESSSQTDTVENSDNSFFKNVAQHSKLIINSETMDSDK